MRRLLPFFLALLAASPASALTLDKIQVTCPVGGESFETIAVMSASTFGMNLDLKPIGATMAPWPLADCPGNGFVFSPGQEFTETEIAAIEPIVNSADYQAIHGETPYFRLAHILRKLGKPSGEISDALLQATWEVEEDPARYDRYARDLLAQLELSIAEGGENIITTKILKAEVLRRIGDFAAAATFVSALLAELPVEHELRWVLDFEQKLISQSDRATHAVSEAAPPEAQ
jgi:hypothetical protein